MTVSGGAPFKRSKFFLALGKIKRGATYCPAALQQTTAVVVVPLSDDKRLPTLFFPCNPIILDDLLGDIDMPVSSTLNIRLGRKLCFYSRSPSRQKNF
jgi:hypothetical protein